MENKKSIVEIAQFTRRDNDVDRISSRRVSKMMEIDHAKLLRKIDGFNEVFRKSKIGFSKYWIESEYGVEGQKRKYREFQVSKKGCEFLAHKTEGEKGILFTDRYMEAFEEMKDYIEKKNTGVIPEEVYRTLSPELQAIFTIDKKYSEVKEDVNVIKDDIQKLKDDLPLFNVECKELQAAVRKLGIKNMGGKNSPSYKDNSLRGRVYRDIQDELRRQFQVTKYEAIKRHQLPMAYKILENYKLPIVLKNAIDIANNQTAFNEVACTKTTE